MASVKFKAFLLIHDSKQLGQTYRSKLNNAITHILDFLQNKTFFVSKYGHHNIVYNVQN